MTDVDHQASLDPPERDAVRRLARAAAEHDGVEALGEHTLLGLEHADRLHLLAREGRALTGYAQVDGTGAAELVVAPEHRRRGVGAALATRLAAAIADPPGRSEVWAHGTLPAARALAARVGAATGRELLQMRCTLADDGPPPAALPDGLTIRSFLPGLDDAAWLAVNSRAFVALPDQGGWTADDLAERLAQPWFDPAGFLLAVDRTDRIRGFHWTKTTEEPDGAGGHVHVGEVYVVGVDPDAQGGGLGRALTIAGLRHLAASGITTVTLFVDAANTAALPMYAALGFAVVRTDTQYLLTGASATFLPSG